MSVFASFTKSDPIPVPHDPPNTVTVRKLTGREIERAQESHAVGVALGRARNWAATFRRVLEHGATVADPVLVSALRDPLMGFDRYALVHAGLVAWTYPSTAEIPKDAGDDTRATLTNAARRSQVEDLDDETVEFIAREILRRTKPLLFETTEDAKAREKETPAAAPVD